MMRSVEPSPPDAPEPRDLVYEDAPPLAAAVLGAEAGLRLGLGLGWLGLGVAPLAFERAGDAAAGRVVAAALLALCGALILAARLPRLAPAAGLGVLLLARAAPLPLLFVCAGAALARVALHGGASGGWLRGVARERRDLALHLAATELARARAAAASDEARREAALHAAGDAYERAGRARRELEGLGAPDGAAAALIGLLARGIGGALRPAPGPRGWLERRLFARSERRDARRRVEALRPGAAADTRA